MTGLCYWRLGPVNAEDEMVVSMAVELGDGLGRVRLELEVDVREALAEASHLVLGQVELLDRPKWFHQVLKAQLSFG